MRQVYLYMLLIVLALVFPGCDYSIAGPEDLIKTPALPAEQEKVIQVVENYLPENTSLTIPLNPQGSGAIQQVDLNGDGRDEVIAFYRSNESDYERGFIILQQDDEGDFKQTGQVQGSSSAITELGYDDISGDGMPEIIVSWDDWQMERLQVYSLRSGEPELIMEGRFTEKAYGDLTGDGIPEIVTVELDKFDTYNQKSTARLYSYSGKEFVLQNESELDGYVGGYDQILIGQVNEKAKGVFFDSVIGAHSGKTDLLLLQDGKLVNALPEVEDIFFKPYPIPSTDVNGDGIIEMGTMKALPGYEYAAMAATMWLEQWHRLESDGELVPVTDTVWNYYGQFRFEIPEEWEENFTVSPITDKEGEDGLAFRFVNEELPAPDEFEVIDPESWVTAQPVILSIYAFIPEVWAEKEGTLSDTGYIKIGENAGRVIVAVQPGTEEQKKVNDKASYKSMLLDREEIVQKTILITD